MQNLILFSGELSGMILKYVRSGIFVSKYKIVFKFKIGTPILPIARIRELSF